MKNLFCPSFFIILINRFLRYLKLVIGIYLLAFLALGPFTPVYAQELSNVDLSEASESANLLIKQVTQSAVEFLNPEEIPKLRLPFNGDFSVSIWFGEEYDNNLAKELGHISESGHTGIDFETPLNTEIISVDNGVVVMAEERQDFGLTVKISHAWGDSLYGHLKEFKVTVGQNVSKDQVIGLSGSSGVTTGPHLHFGIKPKNPILSYMFGFIDPIPYLASKNVILSDSEGSLTDVSNISNNLRDSSPSVQNDKQEIARLAEDESKRATSSATKVGTPRNDKVDVAGVATASAVLIPIESGLIASSSASLTTPKAENIATDSGYLFNYKFNLEKGTTAHFYDKASKSPSFAIADEKYDYRLRFFLKQDTLVIASSSEAKTKQSNASAEIATPRQGGARNDEVQSGPKVESNKVEFPVVVKGIPMTLRYTIDQNRVKEEFIIEEKPSDEILASQGETLQIPFSVESTGLTMQEKNGEYIFTSKDGTVVWRILASTVEDSKGKKGTPDEVKLDIHSVILASEARPESQEDAGQASMTSEQYNTAVLGVSTSFLKEASYPVIIDPTWTQSDWSGGSGQTTWSDSTKFDSSSNVNRTTSGQISIANSEKFTNNTFSTYSSSTGFSSWATGAQPNTVSGLVAWYKADALGLSNNASVSTWTDSSSSGFTLNQTTTTKPTYKTNVINGNPVVRFTRASSTAIGITSTTFAGYFSGASPASTVITVLNPASINSNQRVWSATKSTDGFPFHDFVNSSAAGNPWSGDRRSDAGSFKQAKGANAVAGTSYIGSFVFDGTNAIVYTSGTAGTTTDLAGTLTSLNQFDLGVIRNGGSNINAGSNFFDGDIAEVIVFNDDLTSADRIKIENYLRDKYNITVTSGITTVTQDSTTKFNANSYSAKLVTSSSDTGEFTQSVNVGNTNTYTLDAYVYTDGTEVSTSHAELFYNGATITTTATSMGSGWYKLSGTLTGANESRIYGVQVKANKTVYIGQMNLYEASAYNSSASVTSSIFDTAQRSDWNTVDYTTSSLPGNSSVSVKVRSSDSSSMSGATDFGSCSAITSGGSISTGGCVTDSQRYVQYQVTLSNTDSASTPILTDVSINYSESTPTAPSSFSGSVTGTTSITWSWTDNASDEDGFYVQDTSGNTKCTVFSASITTCTETGLTPNTSYARNVIAYNSGGNSSATSNASATTRQVPVVSLVSPSSASYANNSRPGFKFQTPTTNTTTSKYTDISKYRLTINGPDNTNYIIISDIPASRTTDFDGGGYTVSYEGFDDSDITNNYITVYTKTSSSWGSSSNDGKLKEGKNTWFVLSVDSSDNENAVSNELYADYTAPVFDSLSSADSLGEKDGFLILANITPTITSILTDNFRLNKIVISYFKENYFLGSLSDINLLSSQSYSLKGDDNRTNYALSLKPDSSLDYGSFMVTVVATDEAGNQSQSNLKLKIMTLSKAQVLLNGLAEGEDLINTDISLKNLEKKAILRREREADELKKVIAEIKQGLEDLISEGGKILDGVPQAVSSYLALAQQGLLYTNKTLQLAFDSVINTGVSLLTEAKNNTDKVFQSFDVAINNSQTNFKYAASKVGQDTFDQLDGVDKSIKSLNRQLTALENDFTDQFVDKYAQVNEIANTSEISLLKGYISFKDKIVEEAAFKYDSISQNINLGLDSMNNTVTTIVSGTQKKVEASLDASQTFISATGGQIASVLNESKNQVQSMQSELGKTIASQAGTSIKNIDNQLTYSSEATQARVEELNKNISHKLAQASEASSVAFRSLLKPAVESKNFVDRVGKGVLISFSTFQAYVFDETPTKISNVTIEEVGSDYMTVSWDTNHRTHSNKVNYGENLSYGKEAWGEDGEKHHTVRLTGLKTNTRYFFEVMGQNKNYTYDAYYSFETLQK